MTLKETITRLLGMSTPTDGEAPAGTASDNGARAAAADQDKAPEPEGAPGSDAAASIGSDADDADAPDTKSGA